MKNKANLTISRPTYGDGRKNISIQVRDGSSRIRFLELEIDYESFTEALTGLSEVPCTAEYSDLSKVGKVLETKSVTIQLPSNCRFRDKDLAAKLGREQYNVDGWEISEYFNSQNSFTNPPGAHLAHTTAYRYVEGQTDEN